MKLQFSKTRHWNKALLALFVITGLFLQSGCTLITGFLSSEGCNNSGKGSIPAPPGDRIMEWQVAQAAAALQDQTTLYRADFIGNTDAPSPGAFDKISRALGNGYENQPWFIEPSGNNDLDNARIKRVTDILEFNGITDPSVQLGIPKAIGLPGTFGEQALSNQGTGLTGQNRGTGLSSGLTGFRR